MPDGTDAFDDDDGHACLRETERCDPAAESAADHQATVVLHFVWDPAGGGACGLRAGGTGRLGGSCGAGGCEFGGEGGDARSGNGPEESSAGDVRHGPSAFWRSGGCHAQKLDTYAA